MVRTYRGTPGPLKRLWWALYGKPYKPRTKKKEKELLLKEQQLREKEVDYKLRRAELLEQKLEVEEEKINYEKAKYQRKRAEESAEYEDIMDQDVDSLSSDGVSPENSDANSIETVALNAFLGGLNKRGAGKTGDDRKASDSTTQESRRIIDASEEVNK